MLTGAEGDRAARIADFGPSKVFDAVGMSGLTRSCAIPPYPQRLAEVIDHALTEESRIPFQTFEERKQAIEAAL